MTSPHLSHVMSKQRPLIVACDTAPTVGRVVWIEMDVLLELCQTLFAGDFKRSLSCVASPSRE